MAHWAKLRVTLEKAGAQSVYDVDVRHYEDLKNALDTNDHGWREMDLYEHPSGKGFFQTGHITDLCLMSADWCEKRNEMDQQAKIEGDA